MVASLAKPGGNVTGFSAQTIDLVGKRIEILQELLPELRQLAVIADAGYFASVLEKDEVQSSARKLGIEVVPLAIRRAEDIAPAFEMLKSGTQALYVCAGALVNANRSRFNTLALGARLPTMHGLRDLVGAGGLLSYGPNNTHLLSMSTVGAVVLFMIAIAEQDKRSSEPLARRKQFWITIAGTSASVDAYKYST